MNISPALLQYRNPAMYRDMLDIIGNLQKENSHTIAKC